MTLLLMPRLLYVLITLPDTLLSVHGMSHTFRMHELTSIWLSPGPSHTKQNSSGHQSPSVAMSMAITDRAGLQNAGIFDVLGLVLVLFSLRPKLIVSNLHLLYLSSFSPTLHFPFFQC